MASDDFAFLMERARRSRKLASMTLDVRVAAGLQEAADEYEAKANRLKHKPVDKADS
jgi:hypothetical protein